MHKNEFNDQSRVCVFQQPHGCASFLLGGRWLVPDGNNLENMPDPCPRPELRCPDAAPGCRWEGDCNSPSGHPVSGSEAVLEEGLPPLGTRRQFHLPRSLLVWGFYSGLPFSPPGQSVPGQSVGGF